MINGFFELLLGLYSKFIVLLPGNSDFDVSESTGQIQQFWAYVCYFIPIHDMTIIFGAWCLMISAVVFTFWMIRLFTKIIRGY